MQPQFSPAPPGYPRRFAGYLLLSPIAQGGMGDVFLASTLGAAGAVRLVVIKTLREDLASEPGYVNRFLDEARVVIQLQHANISQVFEVGCHEGTHFFVMEHIAGSNLRRLTALLTRAGSRLSSALAMFIVSEVLDGLHCAHHHRHALTGEPLQVVHRDVSPQNIMISLQGEVKIIDFGLAESTLKLEQTESKVVLGKIAYMPPEQARGDPVDARSDQFSAAVMLYELLTGERYYGERSQGEIWAVAGVGIVPDRLRDLDPELAAILKRALAPKADDRFATCGDFAAALRALLAERNPEVSRGALREFLEQTAAGELETSAKNVRALSQLALRTLPDLATPRAAEHGDDERGTGATQTTALPSAQAPARRAYAAGIGVGAASVALAAAFALVTAYRADAPRPAPAVPAAVPAELAQDLPAPVVDAPTTLAAEPAEAAGSGGEGAVATSAQPDAGSSPNPRVRRARPKKEPVIDRSSWSLAQKLDVVRACDHPCTKTIKSIQTRGATLFPATVDSCVEFCLKR
ncbi:MAG: serine/threonine protein kinase [Deltaproteobacteria bacterium]|nr:serine/threonine protein kinase [Deltaproteobacteria bacterium]